MAQVVAIIATRQDTTGVERRNDTVKAEVFRNGAHFEKGGQKQPERLPTVTVGVMRAQPRRLPRVLKSLQTQPQARSRA